MLDDFNHWATLNPDTAFLIGFSVIVLIFYGLFPYKIGLNIATAMGVPFKLINVGSQIRKPHRFALCLGGIIVFAVFHFGLNAALMALIIGSGPIAVLVVTDSRQMRKDCGPAD